MKRKNHSEPNREYFSTAAPSTLNSENRTVDIVWFTGVDVPRECWNGRYIRRFDPKGLDLSRLNDGAPVFDNHETWNGTQSQKGVVDRAWVDGTLYKATLRFSKRDDVTPLWQDISDRIMQKFSMGVEILAEHEIKADGHLDIKMADKWRPFEISCAPLPADFGTTTLSGKKKDPDDEEDPDEEEPDDDPDDEDDPDKEKDNDDDEDMGKKNKLMQSFRDRDAEILRLR